MALGLLVALSYGVGDFFGGIASKRNRPAAVVAVSQAIGLLALTAVILADRAADPVLDDVIAGGAAGSVGMIGVILLYRGLATGHMSVVAPITAVGAGVVPFLWGIATGERPSALALTGVVAALLAVALVSAADVVEDVTATRQDVLLALGAGAAFGIVFILLGTTESQSGMWPVFAARVMSVSLVTSGVLLTRQRLRPAPGSLPSIAVAGILDVTANGLYVLATREGLLSLVSVLSSLYPAATIVLARVVLAERMNRTQLAGIALAMIGVVLISSG
ncbi:MAG TPA: DMT family transporter [Acidimicrobiales bacterium]|nr:DMT family transporter [Acidimicrobiales bacterium]